MEAALLCDLAEDQTMRVTRVSLTGARPTLVASVVREAAARGLIVEAARLGLILRRAAD